jgi:hypothetical protein
MNMRPINNSLVSGMAMLMLLTFACGGKPSNTLPTGAASGAEVAAQGSASGAPVAKPAEILWQGRVLSTAADALAAWTAIAPTGADWSVKLSDIPNTDEIREPLAKALLNGGNFECPAIALPDACGVNYPGSFVQVAATADFNDPCLRRQLALWSIDQLDDIDAPEVEAGLLAIAALPKPETELIDAALSLLPSSQAGDRLALAMIALIPDFQQRGLLEPPLSDAAAVTALAELHFPYAAAQLDPRIYKSAFIKAVLDPDISPDYRLKIAQDLVNTDDGKLRLDKDIVAAITAAGRSDCRMLGVLQQARRGRPSRSKNPLDQFTSLCQALQSGGAMQSLIDKNGLQLVIQPEPGAAVTTELIPTRSFVSIDNDEDPFISALVTNKNCRQVGSSTVCVANGTRIQFDFKNQAGSYILQRVQLAQRGSLCETVEDYIQSLSATKPASVPL